MKERRPAGASARKKVVLPSLTESMTCSPTEDQSWWESHMTHPPLPRTPLHWRMDPWSCIWSPDGYAYLGFAGSRLAATGPSQTHARIVSKCFTMAPRGL